MSYDAIEIQPPIDPHLRRWMMFVDGENFTMRGQELARKRGIKFIEGECWKRDVFLWFPKVAPTQQLVNHSPCPLKLQAHAIRSYFYTSAAGDIDLIVSVRESLRNLGFCPEVFKRSGQQKAKGVDIALSKDFLSHAFLGNYDVAVLVAGDGDYIPLITEVKRLGKVVYLQFFSDFGLNPELRLASDMFLEMAPFLCDQ